MLPSLKSAHAEMDFKSTPVAVTDRCNITSRCLTLTFSPFHSASLPKTIDYPHRLCIVLAYGEKKAEGTHGKLAEMKERNEED